MMRPGSRRVLVGVIALLAVTLAVGKVQQACDELEEPRPRVEQRVSSSAGPGAERQDSHSRQLRRRTRGPASGDRPGNRSRQHHLAQTRGHEFELNYLKTQVRENKIDAVVVSRLIKVDNTVTYIPGTAYIPPFPYYGTFYGYYGAVYPVVYSPGYLKEEKKVRIETNLYAVSSGEGELVWTCITDTFNPSNVNKAIDRLVKLVVKQMQSEDAL